MNHNYIIKQENITLCPMTTTDSEQYRCLRNLETVRCWFETTDIISRETQELWFSSYLQKDNELMFSIYNDENRFVGGCSLYRIENQSAEFGRLIINPEFQGFGYGKKAIKAALEIAKMIGIQTIHLDVFEDNHIAISTYSSIGFIMTGERFYVNNKPMRSMKKTI